MIRSSGKRRGGCRYPLLCVALSAIAGGDASAVDNFSALTATDVNSLVDVTDTATNDVDRYSIFHESRTDQTPGSVSPGGTLSDVELPLPVPPGWAPFQGYVNEPDPFKRAGGKFHARNDPTPISPAVEAPQEGLMKQRPGSPKGDRSHASSGTLSSSVSVIPSGKSLLGKPRRRLWGLKTLVISLLLLWYFANHREGDNPEIWEWVAVTLAFVGMLRLVRSAFVSTEPVFSFVVSKNSNGIQQQFSVNIGGADERKKSFLAKLVSAVIAVIIAIPVFFIMTGALITLGVAAAAAIGASVALSIFSVIGSLGIGILNAFGACLAAIYPS